MPPRLARARAGASRAGPTPSSAHGNPPSGAAAAQRLEHDPHRRGDQRRRDAPARERADQRADDRDRERHAPRPAARSRRRRSSGSTRAPRRSTRRRTRSRSSAACTRTRAAPGPEQRHERDEDQRPEVERREARARGATPAQPTAARRAASIGLRSWHAGRRSRRHRASRDQAQSRQSCLRFVGELVARAGRGSTTSRGTRRGAGARSAWGHPHGRRHRPRPHRALLRRPPAWRWRCAPGGARRAAPRRRRGGAPRRGRRRRRPPPRRPR